MIAPTRVNGTGRGALLSFVVVVQRTRIVTAGSVSPASSLSSALTTNTQNHPKLRFSLPSCTHQTRRHHLHVSALISSEAFPRSGVEETRATKPRRACVTKEHSGTSTPESISDTHTSTADEWRRALRSIMALVFVFDALKEERC